MLSVRGCLLVMLSTALTVAFLNIPNPVVAIKSGLKSWSKRAIYHQVDLCSQVCYTQILPGLYLSNERAACDKDVLRRLNITHVLTIEGHRLPKATFADTNINTLFIRAYDTPQTHLLSYFPMANAFIEEGLQNGNVLVHCHFGVSRSATLVIAYIMQKYQLNYDQGLAFVRQRRRFVNPNPGFAAQLKEYHRLNYDVKGFHRFEAYVQVNARKHKYKIASFAAVAVGVVVPLILLAVLS